MIKTAIFDLDGTLADTIKDLGKAMNRMLAHFGCPERSPEEIKAAICYGQREFVRRSLPRELRENDVLIEECRKHYAACYDQCYNDSTFAYDGLTEALKTLKSRGIRIAVATNKAHSHALEVMSKCYPDVEFDFIRGNTEDIPAKPDPTIALLAAKETGAAPGECVFVGDSDVDILTGKNAGMRTIGVAWGYRDQALLISVGADTIAHNASELLSLILSL